MKTRKFFVPCNRFSGRLSYANVVATLALFIALAGGAYAATQINGNQIAPHSIPANRLARGAVVPRARLADEVRNLIVSKGRRSRHRHPRHASQDLGAQTTTNSTLITMSVGQTVPVLTVGPFDITAKCFRDSYQPAEPTLELDASATVDWYGGTFYPDGPFKAGDEVKLWSYGGGNRAAPEAATIPEGNTQPGIPRLTADGNDIVTLGGTASVDMIGDCALSLYGIT